MVTRYFLLILGRISNLPKRTFLGRNINCVILLRELIETKVINVILHVKWRDVREVINYIDNITDKQGNTDNAIGSLHKLGYKASLNSRNIKYITLPDGTSFIYIDSYQLGNKSVFHKLIRSQNKKSFFNKISWLISLKKKHTYTTDISSIKILLNFTIRLSEHIYIYI